MFSNLEKTFEKIGAKVKIVLAENRRNGPMIERQQIAVRLNVITKNGKELFEISIRKDVVDKLDLFVLEVLPKERHLVLLARQLDSNGQVVTKNHFLCGHDERHLFVAAVDSVSTVATAKASLKPAEILLNETGLNTKKRNRRKTKIFKRQGEWFFVPAEVMPMPNLVRTDEPLRRNRDSKVHTAQFAYRSGGESVMVCREYPLGLTQSEYKELLSRDARAKAYIWQQMRRSAAVYVRGTVKHADHATIVLDSWHRVFINTERRSDAVGFLD